MAFALQSVFTQYLSAEVELHQSLMKLHLSLTNFFWLYLTERGRKGAFTTRGIQNERMNMLNWEHPEDLELETASFILKQMKRTLQEESQNRRETSTRELLVDVYSHLWTYLFLRRRERAQRVVTTRHFHDQETESRVQVHCEVVVYFLQKQIALLHQSSSSEEGTTFNLSLNRILCYLKQLTRRGRRPSLQTRYDDDKGLEELDWILGRAPPL